MSLSGAIMDSHTLQTMFFSYFSPRSLQSVAAAIPFGLCLYLILSHSPHVDWINAKKGRRSTRRSVLAGGSDLGIYVVALS